MPYVRYETIPEGVGGKNGTQGERKGNQYSRTFMFILYYITLEIRIFIQSCCDESVAVLCCLENVYNIRAMDDKMIVE